MLLVVTALWGSTFVVIKLAVGVVAPSVVILGRFALAAVVFVPWLRRDRRLLLIGVELGFWLCAGYATQTVGLQYTTASQSAFITVLNVIIVPMLAAALGQSVRWPVWVAAVFAVLGVGLLTGGVTHLNAGDGWTLLCALTYAVYVLRLGQNAGRYPLLPLTAAQLWGVVVFAVLWVGSTRPSFAHMPWLLLIYLGLVTTALTTLLQTLGQRWVGAPEAAVIYALEPVWAAVFAFVFLGERLGGVGLSGAGLIVMATVLSQWPAVTARLRGPRPVIMERGSGASRGDGE